MHVLGQLKGLRGPEFHHYQAVPAQLAGHAEAESKESSYCHPGRDSGASRQQQSLYSIREPTSFQTTHLELSFMVPAYWLSAPVPEKLSIFWVIQYPGAFCGEILLLLRSPKGGDLKQMTQSSGLGRLENTLAASSGPRQASGTKIEWAGYSMAPTGLGGLISNSEQKSLF